MTDLGFSAKTLLTADGVPHAPNLAVVVRDKAAIHAQNILVRDRLVRDFAQMKLERAGRNRVAATGKEKIVCVCK